MAKAGPAPRGVSRASGVLGALAQLVITRPVAALWPLTTAVALALMADIIVAVTVDPQLDHAPPECCSSAPTPRPASSV